MPIPMIAARDHNGYNYSGQKFLSVKKGDTFTVELPSLAERLVDKGLAHYGETSATDAPAEPVKSVPVVVSVSSAPPVDKRTKAYKAQYKK